MIKQKKSSQWDGFIALAYTVLNCALYFASFDSFPEHYGILNYRLTELDRSDVSDKCFLALISVCLVPLFYETQRSFSRTHIPNLKLFSTDRFSDSIEAQPIIVVPDVWKTEGKPWFPCLPKWLTPVLSSLYKGVAASTSFAALLKTWSDRNSVAIGVGVPVGLGTFAAQFAILGGDYNFFFDDARYEPIQRFLKVKWCRWAALHAFVGAYNLSNAALYFNACINAYNIYWKKVDLSATRLPTGAFVVLGMATLFLCFSTQRAYSQKLAQVVDKMIDRKELKRTHCISQNKKTYWEQFEDHFGYFLKAEALVTTGYKTFVNAVALISISHSFSGKQKTGTVLGLVLSGLCFVQNGISQYAILKPRESLNQQRNAFVRSEVSSEVCSGIRSGQSMMR